ncbi:MAG: M81 family metallopeptidase [Planctomycetes bacterium]|nr:M81 family metallopeptidase [Planctomycetota bacterium]
MRIAVGGFQHETNTFSPEKATYPEFVAGGGWPALSRGDGLQRAVEGINLPITGAWDVFRAAGHQVVPLTWAACSPSAHVTDEAFEKICAFIIADLADAGAVDGVFLDLHGAAVIESFEDGEGELLRRVRATVGPDVPIVASLDLHANVTRLMVAASDALFIFRTYPHVDMAETGARAAKHLLGLIAGSAGRAKAFRQLPFLIPLTWGCTMVEPGLSVYAAVPPFEKTAGCSLSFACGFPAADIADCGPSVVAYATTQTEADRMADGMVAVVLAKESAYTGQLYDADTAVRLAMETSAHAVKPVVLADTQDNPGGGGNGDTTWLIASLVRQGAKGAVVGVLFDPASAAACHAAGAGKTVRLSLGAVSGQRGHTPYTADYRIEKLGDGKFTATGPMFLGSRMQLGPMALVETSGVRIIVASRKQQAADQSMFRHVGIEPAQQKIIVVKSSVHFRADFQPIAEQILVVEAPGPMIADPSKLAFKRLRTGVRTSPMGKAMIGGKAANGG